MTTQEKNLYLGAWNEWVSMLDKLHAEKDELITLFLANSPEELKPTRTSPVAMMFVSFCFGYEMGRVCRNMR